MSMEMSSMMGESGRPPGNASVHDNRNKIKRRLEPGVLHQRIKELLSIGG
jgi:hypothetical protein